MAESGKIDVLVHNAGQMMFGPAEAFLPEQFAVQYDVNVLGTQRVNRAVLIAREGLEHERWNRYHKTPFCLRRGEVAVIALNRSYLDVGLSAKRFCEMVRIPHKPSMRRTLSGHVRVWRGAGFRPEAIACRLSG